MESQEPQQAEERSRAVQERARELQGRILKVASDPPPNGGVKALLRLVAEGIADFDVVNATTALHRLAKLSPEAQIDGPTPPLAVDRRVVMLVRRYCVCLAQPGCRADPMTVSNAAWALSRLQCYDQNALEAMANAAVSVDQAGKSRLSSFRVQELVVTAWSFAKLGFRAPEFFEAVSARATVQLAEFKPHHVSLLIHACGLLGFRDDRLLAAVTVYVPDQLPQFRSQNVANLLCGLGSLGFHDPRLLQILGGHVASSAPQYAPQELQTAVSAFSRLGMRHTDMLAAAAQEMCRRLPSFAAQDMAAMLQSFSQLEFRPEAALRAAAQAMSEDHRLREFDAPTLASAVLAFARLRYNDKALLAEIAKEVPPRLAEFSLQGVADILYAFGLLGYRSVPFLSAVAAHLGPRVGEAQPQHLANIVYASAQLGFTDERLLTAVAGELSSPGRLAECTPHGIATVVQALGHLGLAHGGFLQAVGDHLPRRLPECEAHHVAQVLSGMAALRFRHVPLLCAASLHLPGRMNECAPTDVAGIVAALAELGATDKDLVLAITKAMPQLMPSCKEQELASLAWYLTLHYRLLGLDPMNPVSACAAHLAQSLPRWRRHVHGRVWVRAINAFRPVRDRLPEWPALEASYREDVLHPALQHVRSGNVTALEAMELDDLGSQCSGELLSSLCAGPTTGEFQAVARSHLAAPQTNPGEQQRLQRGLCFLAFTLGDGRSGGGLSAEERGIVVGPRPAPAQGEGGMAGSRIANGRLREAERAALDIVLAAGASAQQTRNQQQKVLGQVQIHIAHTPCAAFLATLPALRGRFMIWISFDDAWEGRWGESLPSQQYRAGNIGASGDAGANANARGGRGRGSRPAPWSIEREYDCWGDPAAQANGFAPSPRGTRNSTGNIGAHMAKVQGRAAPKAAAGGPGAAGRIFQAATNAAVGQGGSRLSADDSPSSSAASTPVSQANQGNLTPRGMQTLGAAPSKRPVIPPLGGLGGMPENGRPIVPPLGGMPVPEGATAPVPFAPRLSLPVERDPNWNAWNGPMSARGRIESARGGPGGHFESMVAETIADRNNDVSRAPLSARGEGPGDLGARLGGVGQRRRRGRRSGAGRGLGVAGGAQDWYDMPDVPIQPAQQAGKLEWQQSQHMEQLRLQQQQAQAAAAAVGPEPIDISVPAVPQAASGPERAQDANVSLQRELWQSKKEAQELREQVEALRRQLSKRPDAEEAAHSAEVAKEGSPDDDEPWD